jgi:hypothetical protein
LRLTVKEYWAQQLAALSKRSVYPAHGVEPFIADRAGNPHKGIIDAVLYFTAEATLDAYERIEVDEDGVVRRTQYSYHLRIEGTNLLRVDFDPDLPEDIRYHVNRPSDQGTWTHEPAERITLMAFVDECWGYITNHYESSDT